MSKHHDPLNLIQISSPCSADWDSMIGNEQVRFCSHCNLHVHNLSTMTRSEAMALVAKSEGRLCARFYRRPDGTVQTAPPSGQLHHIARRASRIAATAFGAVLSLSASAAAQNSSSQGELLQGDVAQVTQPEGSRPTKATGGMSASIVGTVFDSQSAVVPGAEATLTNQRTGLEQTTTSDEEGVFRFQSLAAGVYTLTVESPGFGVYRQEDIYLQENTEQQVKATLNASVMGLMIMAVPPDAPLIKAAWENDLATVKELLAKGVEVNTVIDYFGTALSQAVARGNVEMVSALLWAGADVNVKDSSGRTALMFLGEDGNAEVVKALVAAGAQIDLQDVDENTALLLVASQNKVDVLQALLDAGASVNVRNKEGRTALMQAAEAGALDNVRALIKAGAEINARDKNGSTALSLAHDTEVEELLQAHEAIE